MKYVVDLPRRKRAFGLHPPIQHKDECRGYVLYKKRLGNLACPFSPALKCADFFGDQFSQHLLKVPMKDDSAPWPQLELSRLAVPMVMFEDGQAEPENSCDLTAIGL